MPRARCSRPSPQESSQIIAPWPRSPSPGPTGKPRDRSPAQPVDDIAKLAKIKHRPSPHEKIPPTQPLSGGRVALPRSAENATAGSARPAPHHNRRGSCCCRSSRTTPPHSTEVAERHGLRRRPASRRDRSGSTARTRGCRCSWPGYQSALNAVPDPRSMPIDTHGPDSTQIEKRSRGSGQLGYFWELLVADSRRTILQQRCD